MRSLITALGALAFVAVPAAQSPNRERSAAALADRWEQFRGNPQLTGVSVGTLPEKLSLAWTYEAGESIEASAAIAEGSVYIGSQAGELVALEQATGKVRWKYRTKMGIGESSPAALNGIVYVGDLSGTMHAVDAHTGKAIWTFNTEREIKSSPVLAEGKVLFGSYDEHFYALNAKTGTLVWKLTTDGPVHATAAILEGVAYISGCDGQFRAVRMADGKELFRVDAGAYTGASPALERASRRFAYFGTFNNEVLAVNLETRRVAWRYAHPERKFPYYSSAALLDGKVVVGGRDKLVRALDSSTGKALWTFSARARVDSSPAIANGRVYVGSNDGRFYVLDLKSGAKIWEFEAGAPLSASPAIAAGSVMIGSQDGVLYCFR